MYGCLKGHRTGAGLVASRVTTPLGANMTHTRVTFHHTDRTPDIGPSLRPSHRNSDFAATMTMRWFCAADVDVGEWEWLATSGADRASPRADCFKRSSRNNRYNWAKLTLVIRVSGIVSPRPFLLVEPHAAVRGAMAGEGWASESYVAISGDVCSRLLVGVQRVVG